MKNLFYLMGKSAVGKDKIYRLLLKREDLALVPLITYTTRPKREKEIDGREYFFVTEEQMEKMEEEGRILECRMYPSVIGPWYYFTAKGEEKDPDDRNYLGIGTLESYTKIHAALEKEGKSEIYPLYIESADLTRLERSIRRESKEEQPKYDEVCRRYLADQQDFSEEKLREAGISLRFSNDGELEDCFEEIASYIFKLL